MADVDPDTRVTVPEQVAVTPLALPGQPATDRGYVTANGTKLRARLVTIDEVPTVAPTNGTARLAPSGMVLSLTFAVLKDDLTVDEDATGALLITGTHQILWSDEAMKNAAFDPKADVDRIVREQAFLVETRLAKRAAAADYLRSAWGAAPLAAD